MKLCEYTSIVRVRQSFDVSQKLSYCSLMAEMLFLAKALLFNMSDGSLKFV